MDQSWWPVSELISYVVCQQASLFLHTALDAIYEVTCDQRSEWSKEGFGQIEAYKYALC